MSKRRRQRNRNSNGSSGDKARTRSRSRDGNRGSSSGGRRKRSRGKNRRQRDSRDHKQDQAKAFWGEASQLPAPPEIAITDEPDAVVRSLDPPPLPGHEQIVGHYFAAVYERATQMAGALAAVGGLVEPEDLEDPSED